MPPHDPVESSDDDADKWKHDDITEQNPRQRRAAEIAEFDAHQRWLYETMSKLRDRIYESLRHPWRQP